MWWIRKPTVFFLCLLQLAVLSGQEQANDIEHRLESKAFGKERTVRVHIPDRYYDDSSQTFIVTYVLDAHYDPFWEMAKGNIDYMVNSYNVLPMIAVGIASDDRGKEFRPPANELSEHLVNEVFPLIKANYRVNDFRVILGHSWGGAFVTSTLFSDRSAMFDAYINISPSLGFRDEIILQMADSILQTQPKMGKFLYASHGSVGYREDNFGGQVAKLDSLIRHYSNETLGWKKRTIEGTGHWSCVVPSVSDGLISMSQNYWFTQQMMEAWIDQSKGDLMKGIKAFEQKQAAHFGYTHQPSANYLRFCGQDFLTQEKYEAAIALLKWSVELDGESVRAHIALSDAYIQNKNQAEAVQSLKQTSKMLDKYKSKYSEENYKDIKDWIEEQMAEMRK
ncbi:MAG: alpha/beta hydrolase-fold protein [Bacteroidota bacterium]